MTQISKRHLPQETLKKILDIFLVSFSKIENKDVAQNFFEEFLTPTEKIMLAKRITCFYLIYKKVPMKEINEVLKLSSATIAKYSLLFKQSKVIKDILNTILRKDNFFRLIDTFINEYLSPPTRYMTDWKAGWRIYNEYQKRKSFPL